METHLGIRWLLPLAVFAGTFTAGCESYQKQDPARDENWTVRQDKDIAAPRNFTLDKDQSRSFILYDYTTGVGGFRCTTNYYYGDQQIGNLVPWYVEQMRIDGWAHKSTSDESEKKRMVFTKTGVMGDETGTVWIYREFDPRFDKYLTFVKTEVHPTRSEDMAVEDLLPSDAGTRTPAPAATPEGGVEPAAEPAGKDIIRSALPEDEEDAGIAPAAARTAAPRETAKTGNKQVVNEEPAPENNESRGEEQTSPDDDAADDDVTR